MGKNVNKHLAKKDIQIVNIAQELDKNITLLGNSKLKS